MSKAKNMKGVPLMIIGVLLIVAALVLVIYNQWEDSQAGDASEMALESLESMIFDLDGGDEEADDTEWIVPDPAVTPII